MVKFNILALLAALSPMVLAAPLEWVAPYYPAAEYGIDGDYIVRLREGYSLADNPKAVPVLETVVGLTEMPFKWGYNARLSSIIFELVRRDEGVEFIEQNSGGEWVDVQGAPESAVTLKPRAEQHGLGYALRYLSTKVKNPPGSGSYYYQKNSGTGVNVYVMDTGINVGLEEFENRASNKINYSDEDYTDIADHGTRTASVLGGKTYGVAKKPTIFNVKFSEGGNPNTARWMQAMNDIINEHNSLKGKSSFKGSIINMSFKTDASQAASQVLETALNAGISMVAAAGNVNKNARNTFPCNDVHVICVGGCTSKYQNSTSSNHGQAVDYIAPGEGVDSLKNDDTATTTTGSSIAAPFVAGIISIYYDFEGKGMNPSLARQRLDKNADAYLENLPNTQINRLVNTGFQKASGGGAPYLQ